MPQELQQAAFLQAFAVCGLPADAEQHSPLPGATDGEGRFMPHVVDHLPAGAHNELPKHFALCCMPEGVHVAMPGSSTPSRVYSTMLTGATGNRLYVVCLSYYEDVPSSLACKHLSWQGARASRALCMCSSHPYLCSMAMALKQLYAAVFITGTRMAVPDMLQHLLRLPSPADGVVQVTLDLAGLPLQLLPPLPGMHGLPLHELPVKPLTESLHVDNLVTLFLAVLLEKRVLLRCQHLRLLGQACEAIRTLMYPLKALHTMIPILPLPLVDYLEAPTPFLMGLAADVPLDPMVLASLVVVDLDRDCVAHHPHDYEDDLSQLLATPPVQQVRSRLRHLLAPATTDSGLLDASTLKTAVHAQTSSVSHEPTQELQPAAATAAANKATQLSAGARSTSDPMTEQHPAEAAEARAKLAAAAVSGDPMDAWCQQARALAGQGWCWKHENFARRVFLNCMAELLDGYHAFLPSTTTTSHNNGLSTTSNCCSPSKLNACSGRLATGFPAANTSFAEGLSNLAPALSTTPQLDSIFDAGQQSSTELRTSFAFDVAAAVAAAGKCDGTAAAMASSSVHGTPTSRQASRAEVLLQGWSSGMITGRSGGSGRSVLDAIRQSSMSSSAGGMVGVLSRAGSSRPTAPFNAMGFVAHREKSCRQTSALLSLLVQTQGFYDFLAEQSKLMQRCSISDPTAAAASKATSTKCDSSPMHVDKQSQAAAWDAYAWLHDAMEALMLDPSWSNSTGSNSISNQPSAVAVAAASPFSTPHADLAGSHTAVAGCIASTVAMGRAPMSSTEAAANCTVSAAEQVSAAPCALPLPGMWPPLQAGRQLTTPPCAPALLQPYFTAPYRCFPSLWLSESHLAGRSNATSSKHTKQAALGSGGGQQEHSGCLTTSQQLNTRASLRRSHSMADISGPIHPHPQLSGLHSYESSLAGDLACAALLHGYPSILMGQSSLSTCLGQQQASQDQGQTPLAGMPQQHAGGHYANLSMGGALEVAAHVAGLRYHMLSSSSGCLSSTSSRQLSGTGAGVQLSTGTSPMGSTSPHLDSCSPRPIPTLTSPPGKLPRSIGLHEHGHATENGMVAAGGTVASRLSTGEGAVASKHSRFLSASSTFFQQLPGSFLLSSKQASKQQTGPHIHLLSPREGNSEVSCSAWSEAHLIHQQANALHYLLEPHSNQHQAVPDDQSQAADMPTGTVVQPAVKQQSVAQPLIELAAERRDADACLAAGKVLKLHLGASSWLLIMRLHEELGLLVAATAVGPSHAAVQISNTTATTSQASGSVQAASQPWQQVEAVSPFAGSRKPVAPAGVSVFQAAAVDVKSPLAGAGLVENDNKGKVLRMQRYTLKQSAQIRRSLGPHQFAALVEMLASLVNVAVRWRDWWALAALLHATSCIACSSGSGQQESALQALGRVQALMHSTHVWSCLLRSLLIGGTNPLLISKPCASDRPSTQHADNLVTLSPDHGMVGKANPTVAALAAAKPVPSASKSSKKGSPIPAAAQKPEEATKDSKTKGTFLSKVSASKHKGKATHSTASTVGTQAQQARSPFAGASAAEAVLADMAGLGLSHPATAAKKAGDAHMWRPTNEVGPSQHLGPLRTAQLDDAECNQPGVLRPGVLVALQEAVAWMACVGLQEEGAWKLVLRLATAHVHHDQQRSHVEHGQRHVGLATQAQVQRFGQQLLSLRAALRAAAHCCATSTSHGSQTSRALVPCAHACTPVRCTTLPAAGQPHPAEQSNQLHSKSERMTAGSICTSRSPSKGAAFALVRALPVGTKSSPAAESIKASGYAVKAQQSQQPCDIPSALLNLPPGSETSSHGSHSAAVPVSVTSPYKSSPRTPSRLGDRPGWQDSSPESLRQVVKSRAAMKSSTDSMLLCLQSEASNSCFQKLSGTTAFSPQGLVPEPSTAQLSVIGSDADSVTLAEKGKQETCWLPMHTVSTTNGMGAAAVIQSVTPSEVQLLASAAGVCIISCAPDSACSPVTLYVLRGTVPGAATVSLNSYPVPSAWGGCSQLAVTEDGHTCVVAGRGDGGLHVLDSGTGRLLTSLTPSHAHGVTALQLSPTGAVLVSGGADGWVRMWDIRRQPGRGMRSKPLLSLKARTGADDNRPVAAVTAVHLDSSRNQVVCGSADGLIHVWDLHHTSQPRSQLRGHTASVTALVALPSPSSQSTMQLLASCSADWTIRIWDLSDGVDRATQSPASSQQSQPPENGEKQTNGAIAIPDLSNSNCAADELIPALHGIADCGAGQGQTHGGTCCAMLVGHGGPITRARVISNPHSSSSTNSSRQCAAGDISGSGQHDVGCYLATSAADGCMAVWDIHAALQTPGAGCTALARLHDAPVIALECAQKQAGAAVLKPAKPGTGLNGSLQQQFVTVAKDGSMCFVATDTTSTGGVSTPYGGLCELNSVDQHHVAVEGAHVVAAYDHSTCTVYTGTATGDVHIWHSSAS